VIGSGQGDSLLEKGGKPRARTTAYRVLRFCERFPAIADTPEAFYRLSEDDQCYFLAYELIRECEEAMRLG
jgi:hypothetical protein